MIHNSRAIQSDKLESKIKYAARFRAPLKMSQLLFFSYFIVCLMFVLQFMVNKDV